MLNVSSSFVIIHDEMDNEGRLSVDDSCWSPYAKHVERDTVASSASLFSFVLGRAIPLQNRTEKIMNFVA